MVRCKRRYIVIEVYSSDGNIGKVKSNAQIFKETFKEAVKQKFGDHGVSAAMFGFHVIYSSEGTGTYILQTLKGPHKMIEVVIPFINEMGKRKVVIKSLSVKASLRKSFQFLKIYHANEIKKENEKNK